MYANEILRLLVEVWRSRIESGQRPDNETNDINFGQMYRKTIEIKALI
jgi:hypothetical protein